MYRDSKKLEPLFSMKEGSYETPLREQTDGFPVGPSKFYCSDQADSYVAKKQKKLHEISSGIKLTYLHYRLGGRFCV
jgi:hypothetical protein